MPGKKRPHCDADDRPSDGCRLCSQGLLALYPGVRQTGWAIFRVGDGPLPSGWAVAASGIVSLKTRQRVGPEERISHLLATLSEIALRWQPGCAVLSRPGGLTLGAPGREELDAALQAWADDMGLPLTGYSAPEVRSAIAGRPNASKDALAHAVMLHLELIGQNRAAAEWEAIAAGCHHLQWLAKGQVCSEAVC